MLSFLRPSGTRVERISGPDAIAQAAKGELIIIDVRDMGEIRATGKAKGALHIPMATIAMRADPKSPDYEKKLKTDVPVALYCASGARSQMAGQLMLKLGYEKVYNLGGFAAWARAGGPVSR